MRRAQTWLPPGVLAALAVAMMLTPSGRAGEVGYVEDFALSSNRADALKQLVPGTEDYYYFHALHLCAVLPNVRIMEIDIDDVPWKGTLVTRPPDIRDGHIWLTDAPGWGADIDEEVLKAHPWPAAGASAPQQFYGMAAEQMARRG